MNKSTRDTKNQSLQKFAVFDIDGTLIRWQLYHAAVDELIKRRLLPQNIAEELRAARMRWKRREHKQSFNEYEEVLIGAFENNIEAIDEVSFEQAIRSTIKKYQDQTYTYTRDLIKHLKKEGYFLLAISGSHQELIRYIADYYGFDDYIGSNYERRDGRFTGVAHIASIDKGVTLQDLIKKHKLTTKDSVAVGDTKSDIPLLEIVDKPIAFNPEEQLYTKAIAKGWKIVVERKNVIYELRQKNGSYVLA